MYLCGGVGSLGGALSETWDTLRMLKLRGVDVSLLSEHPLESSTRARLSSLGCPAFEFTDESLNSVPRLAGSIVIGICSPRFLALAPQLRELGCRLAWYNCMRWVFPGEEPYYKQHGFFDVHLYNAPSQRAALEAMLAPLGYEPTRGHLIRPAFEFNEWDFAPRKRISGADFVIGRLARPELGKWSNRTWEIYGSVRASSRRALLMGVDETIRKWLGPAPDWAELLPPCALSTAEFYRRIHCLAPICFASLECWPRIGLEAMAAGVPIVAPREGGWCDMITSGENGFLASSPDELIEQASALAADETFRLRIAHKARQRLETDLANADLVWSGWQQVLQVLGTR